MRIDVCACVFGYAAHSKMLYAATDAPFSLWNVKWRNRSLDVDIHSHIIIIIGYWIGAKDVCRSSRRLESQIMEYWIRAGNNYVPFGVQLKPNRMKFSPVTPDPMRPKRKVCVFSFIFSFLFVPNRNYFVFLRWKYWKKIEVFAQYGAAHGFLSKV